MNNTTIKETRELVRALTAVAVRLIDDLKDGKISMAEGLGFLSDFAVIRQGVQGIASVPAELADLNDEERETLLADIGAALTGAGLSHRIADAAEKILRWAHHTVRTFVDLRHAPPTAHPVNPS
jgi:hypothetical protein